MSIRIRWTVLLLLILMDPVVAQPLSTPKPAVPRPSGVPTKKPVGLPTPKLTPIPKLTPLLIGPPRPPELSITGIPLNELPLIPDPKLAGQVEVTFNAKLAILNTQITDKQAKLYELLTQWGSSEILIRSTQVDLSELRTERDRLALEHLLLIRQLRENFVIPQPVRPTPLPSPQPSR